MESTTEQPTNRLSDSNTVRLRAPIEYAFDPIREVFNDSLVSEICVNEPGSIWVERIGIEGMEHIPVPEFTFDKLCRLSERIAEACGQSISPESPLLFATLHNGDRVQVVSPPNCGRGKFVISIRKQVIKDIGLDYLDDSGFFKRTGSSGIDAASVNARLRSLLDERKFVQFITEAVRAKKNIIISGGTSTGKTTTLNAIAKVIPFTERLISIEDVNDVVLPQPNVASLIYSKSSSDSSEVSVDRLLEACMRLRPDRILLSEITGSEAFAYMNSVETGHPGSITTIHANSPSGVYRRLAFLLQQSDMGFTAETATQYAKANTDVIIQISRNGGVRSASDIEFTERD